MSRHTTGVDQRCSRCRLAPRLCLCGEVTPIPTAVELLVLRHVKERHKGSNSARLVDMACPNSSLRDWAVRDQPMDTSGLSGPGVALLFPMSEGAVAAEPEQIQRLVVVDGTWTQARKMLKRIPGLSELPRLDIGGLSAGQRVRMRRPPHPGMVATAEAVAHALELLEGPQAAQALIDLYELQVSRVWQSRGRVGGRPWDEAKDEPPQQGGCSA
ncbi:MAG: tRNA-uridine aminocarboxypropyltransferase [Myxococcota bacterium]|nr:tRNA-uridine aminocarboxypropyltransferase [Myxococcota bacterium]